MSKFCREKKSGSSKSAVDTFMETICIEKHAISYVALYHVNYHAYNDVWQVSVRSENVAEGLEEPSTPRRRGGHAGRELKRLQRRAQKDLDDWLDYYRVAIGLYNL